MFWNSLLPMLCFDTRELNREEKAENQIRFYWIELSFFFLSIRCISLYPIQQYHLKFIHQEVVSVRKIKLSPLFML